MDVFYYEVNIIYKWLILYYATYDRKSNTFCPPYFVDITLHIMINLSDILAWTDVATSASH